ncbi:hypothetical protein T03_9740 [Trichinella britovi]|uniref:Uncharacterized protein n=1 Tax=Trichinella britovi TaxID=45882 RepID=A0A0V1CP40_TRIBR|nr:hypothetical protein T03_9740 [Trichinella britovi]
MLNSMAKPNFHANANADKKHVAFLVKRQTKEIKEINTCTNETRENYNVTAALVPQQMIEALMRAYSEETMTMLKIINFAFHNTDSMKG